ncbi:MULTISPECIES: TatD family hydrolase [unclassified Flavobacterium]|uniref:TatD family hydrolase n=1 Tax=unclassified Flavobacterium TaxID=196869 RepID=UPI00156E38A6|nr:MULTISPECIES: TatD family hydrolase [unclassified Flavobacterium]MBE0392987.1 3'-5' ssDNA/RNA exonuclease TatD [Flavobacterium sp. PL002]NRT13905.1 TatD DNase family protein [Flavobacterium sp. 28A]
MTTYIDIGINLTNKQFYNDIDNIIQDAVKANVSKMIITGTSIKNSEQSALIATKHPDTLYTTAGIHPHEAKNFDNQSISKLKELLLQPQVVAVGECGLDFDRDFSPRNIQESCYEAQLALAIETQKPLFLHERAAFSRFISITNQYLPELPKAVVHCFTGTLQEAKIYLDNGFYLGFTGAISDTWRFQHLKEVLQYIPLNKIMIETDAPFMLPKNVTKNLLKKQHERRCEPAFLPFIAETIAHFKGITIDKVAEHTTLNSKTFFGI